MSDALARQIAAWATDDVYVTALIEAGHRNLTITTSGWHWTDDGLLSAEVESFLLFVNPSRIVYAHPAVDETEGISPSPFGEGGVR